MAKPPTPTVREITKKLRHLGFRETQREAVLTKKKGPSEEGKKATEPLADLMALKEPKTTYSRKKK